MNTWQVENCVSEIEDEDLLNIVGGGIWDKIYDATIGYVVGEVIDGFARGASTPCTNKC